MATKHNQILEHINNLPVGHKISVRQIAKDLSVSEGTAYRAIKDAENKGYVSTIERVGTIRIEQKKKENIEKLTYAEVVNIVDGQVLGGREGLHKTLNKFVIGAMKLEAMMRYTEAGNLLIIGNRTNAHQLALERGAAVLITGGFDTEDYVKKLADELKLPIISSSYDTFTVATLINRAIYDQLIKKEIVLVEDILTPIEETLYLKPDDKVERWHAYNKETMHGRYPIIDDNKKVLGIVTSKDMIGVAKETPIEKVMTKQPITVNGKMSVAAAARMMVWEGIEMLPVVDEGSKLQGIISRQDVLQALQMIQRQPQVGETIDDIVTSQFVNQKETKHEQNYQFSVTPQMTNSLGTLSYGVFTTIVTEATNRVIRAQKKSDLIVENLTIYFVKPVQIDHIVSVHPKVLEIGRKFGKVDVEVHHEGNVVGKALLMVQLIDR
ncbi:DRTGG domain-containing protein [Bacillus cytotoxicus]|uniref:CBS domain-containing protein n=1 Tax=Bacillus cereus group sp. BfR-BA-01492 TaxID=2920361 RepID=UPI001F56BE3B|nr:CBS domain-containing protein [Bacillus cereus group sp. BfR-BA-01492]EMA6342669.1 CBS domain-containing protein [Bacillus cytotoxicus]